MGSRSKKLVCFCDYDPGSVGIEAKPVLGFRGNLDGIGGVGRRAVCNGEYQQIPFVVVVDDRHNDGALPILGSFFAPGLVLAPPQVGIADDQAGVRLQRRHRLQSMISLSKPAYWSGTRALRMASS